MSLGTLTHQSSGPSQPQSQRGHCVAPVTQLAPGVTGKEWSRGGWGPEPPGPSRPQAAPIGRQGHLSWPTCLTCLCHYPRPVTEVESRAGQAWPSHSCVRSPLTTAAGGSPPGSPDARRLVYTHRKQQAARLGLVSGRGLEALVPSTLERNHESENTGSEPRVEGVAGVVEKTG